MKYGVPAFPQSSAHALEVGIPFWTMAVLKRPMQRQSWPEKSTPTCAEPRGGSVERVAGGGDRVEVGAAG